MSFASEQQASLEEPVRILVQEGPSWAHLIVLLLGIFCTFFFFFFGF